MTTVAVGGDNDDDENDEDDEVGTRVRVGFFQYRATLLTFP